MICNSNIHTISSGTTKGKTPLPVWPACLAKNHRATTLHIINYEWCSFGLWVMFIWEFINTISAVNSRHPSVSGWWSIVQLYMYKTGPNISRTVRLGQEKNDRFYSHGKSLTRLAIQCVIKSAVTARLKSLPVNARSSLYLLLTSDDVVVQDFCR